ADDVLQHRGPGQLPDGAPDRSLDDRSVESPARAWDLHRIPPRRAGRLQIQSRSGLSVTYRSLTRTRLHALRARPARKTCKLIDARRHPPSPPGRHPGPSAALPQTMMRESAAAGDIHLRRRAGAPGAGPSPLHTAGAAEPPSPGPLAYFGPAC